MNAVVTFAVISPPVPKPVGPRTAKSTMGWKRYLAHKKAIGYAANGLFPTPLDGACSLGCLFWMPCETATFSAAQLRLAATGEIAPTRKPDLKNLVAAVEDSLTGIAWRDDSQVVIYPFMAMRYAVNQPPRTVIAIRPLPRGLAGLPPIQSLWPEALRNE